MKKITRILFLAGALSVFAVTNSNAQQIVIKARLHGPVHEVRPVRPTREHVWVSGEYVPNGGTYVYKPGYWAVPPRPHQVWVTGRWHRYHHGYVWAPGHWA